LNDSKEHLLPSIDELFNDVYDELTENLKEQKAFLNQHI